MVKAEKKISKEGLPRSCKDLFMCSPKKNDGTYKIDPNLGCDDDAFKADCVKNTKCTCMGCDFVRDISAVQTWTAPRNLLNVTFSRVTNGFEVGWFYFCVSALKNALGPLWWCAHRNVCTFYLVLT